jgi:hypothetical protein
MHRNHRTSMDGDSDGDSDHSSQVETQFSTCIVARSESPPMNDDPYALQNLFDESGEYLHSYVVPETFTPSFGGGPAGGGPAEALPPGRLQVVRSREDMQVVRSRMQTLPKLPQIPLAVVPPNNARQAHDRLKPAFVSSFKNVHRFYDEKSRAVAIVSWKFCDAEEIWAITTCKMLCAGKQETMVAFCLSFRIICSSFPCRHGLIERQFVTFMKHVLAS